MRMTKSIVVTRDGPEVDIVTIDVPDVVPHSDLLVALAAGLTRWRDQALRLDAGMAELRDDDPGVYLDPDGTPVVPGWYERKNGDRHVAWYLIWSHAHSRATGCKRRQYVRAAEVEAARVKVRRTREYRDLAARRVRLEARIARLGRELTGLVEEHELIEEHRLVTKLTASGGAPVTTQPDAEMVTAPAHVRSAPVTSQPDNGLVTETTALGSDSVTTAELATKPAHLVGAPVTSRREPGDRQL